MNPDSNFYVIGAGGVASYLLPCLRKLIKGDHITIIDGDVLEPKNLDRQLFSPRYVGEYKAEALAEMHGTNYTPRYLRSIEDLDCKDIDIIMVCADNHPARKLAMEICDRDSCFSIIAGNEYTDAESYVYDFTMKDSTLDPRRRHPELLTSTAGSPFACQGEAANSSPQLCISNMLAAAYMLHLLWIWYFHEDPLPFDLNPAWHHSNFAKLQSTNISDIIKIYASSNV